MTVEFDEHDLFEETQEMLRMMWQVFMRRHGLPHQTAMLDRRFRAAFGVSPTVAAKVWLMLSQRFVWRIAFESRKKFLWALMFPFVYCNEHQMAIICGADEKTIRNWVWFFIMEISNLEDEVVSERGCDDCLFGFQSVL
jgi:hypothetical protein